MRIDWFKLRRGDEIAYQHTGELETAAMTFLMKEMTNAARLVEADLVVVYIPPLLPNQTVPPPEALTRALPASVHLLDLTDLVRDHHRAGGEALVLDDQFHPNAAGNRLIGAALAPFLRDLPDNQLETRIPP